MLEKEINEGDELIALLSNLATLVGQASSSHSADHVRFARRLDDWRSRVEARLLESLGEDPRSRFNYLNHVFRSDCSLLATGLGPVMSRPWRESSPYLGTFRSGSLLAAARRSMTGANPSGGCPDSC
jgi:hypothetical protein